MLYARKDITASTRKEWAPPECLKSKSLPRNYQKFWGKKFSFLRQRKPYNSKAASGVIQKSSRELLCYPRYSTDLYLSFLLDHSKNSSRKGVFLRQRRESSLGSFLQASARFLYIRNSMLQISTAVGGFSSPA